MAGVPGEGIVVQLPGVNLASGDLRLSGSAARTRQQLASELITRGGASELSSGGRRAVDDSEVAHFVDT